MLALSVKYFAKIVKCSAIIERTYALRPVVFTSLSRLFDLYVKVATLDLQQEVGLFGPFYDVGSEIPVYAHYCRRQHKSPKQR